MRTIPYTAMGNSKFAGNAAMNCAIGCTICAARGRIPTQMPIGTHTRLARAIKTNTRSIVISARPQTCRASCIEVFVIRPATMCQSPSTTAATISDTHSRSRLRFGAPVGASSVRLRRRLTARLVHSTAA